MKIIEHGKYRVVKCSNCGCKFSFGLDEVEEEKDIQPLYDLSEYYIKCPECDMCIPLNKKGEQL